MDLTLNEVLLLYSDDQPSAGALSLRILDKHLQVNRELH